MLWYCSIGEGLCSGRVQGEKCLGIGNKSHQHSFVVQSAAMARDSSRASKLGYGPCALKPGNRETSSRGLQKCKLQILPPAFAFVPIIILSQYIESHTFYRSQKLSWRLVSISIGSSLACSVLADLLLRAEQRRLLEQVISSAHRDSKATAIAMLTTDS